MNSLSTSEYEAARLANDNYALAGIANELGICIDSVNRLLRQARRKGVRVPAFDKEGRPPSFLPSYRVCLRGGHSVCP